DERDREVGLAPKLEAHERGLLHRAFSVFVLNGRGELLLQRRAAGKYHCGGLWTNSCCGHPRPGEPVAAGARRRLREEMGIDCEMTPAGTFVYRADVGGGLVEHEYDHVFLARHDADPSPDPAEADAWRWAPVDAVIAEAEASPAAFTPWFVLALREVMQRDPSEAPA
ncbi:MAG TPA: isopentenyl-diphosphate Delta-isomerase, partial [Longimicrobium sp.]|nr:isopentenyl-diphosphate Delta-isomerase [Longimicrobium sp.]